MEENIIKDYRERAGYAAEQAAKFKKLSEAYSLYRLVLFGLFIACVCIAVKFDEIIIIALALAVLIVCFSWLVKKQNGFDVLKNYWQDIKRVNENEIDSINTGANMYVNGATFNNDKHYYTADLDIFGPNSLFQLLNRAATAPGIGKLAQWLAAPASRETILLRQQAVEEIAGKNDWKLDFQAHLVFCLKQQKEQIKNLLGYLKLPVETETSPLLNFYIVVAPWLLLATIIAAVFYVPARYLAPMLALTNYRLVSSRKETVNKTDLIAGRIGKTLVHFVCAFKSIEEEQWQSGCLQGLYAKISAGEGESISGKIRQLSILINRLNYRLNLLVGAVLNTFMLWDVRQVIAIENWKRANHQDFETAFDAIAEFEALVSLASLRINYTGWCVPQIAEGEGYTLVTNRLGHPLINSGKRIENDYELPGVHKIDIITGSNMAGKSTFLRTIGINTVLALSGAPVCAAGFTVSVMTVITYMRIKDSLNESTSTFKAELDRLQMLLNAVEGDRQVFFLIDEMLRGTNSVDKYLGSKAVIERLISKTAVGMVATHDLQIAELEQKYPNYIRNFYFDIQVKNGQMLFDYKLKHGECKTFNASLLLKQIGIDVGE